MSYIQKILKLLGIDYEVMSYEEGLSLILNYHIENLNTEYDGEMDWHE